jgi:SAM-dependent methyltransferase
VTDFIFTEAGGELTPVFDFDGLYRAESDPWGQSARDGDMAAYYGHSRQRLIDALWPLHKGVGLEVGCGHGDVTALLTFGLGLPFEGMDISPAAIEEAKRRQPGFAFHCGDITKEHIPARQFGTVIWSQIWWYVMADWKAALDNTLAMIHPGGLFVVSQAFLSDQKYGREIADGFDGARILLQSRLNLIHADYDDSGRYCHNDGLMVFRV